MLLQLRPLFMGELSTLPVDAELDFSAETLGNAKPFLTPVRVQGTVTASADVVVLRAEISFIYHGQCDRCLRNYEKRYTLPIEHILVDTLSDDENDDFVLLQQYQLPLDDLVMSDMLLELPYKSLCRENCRGLCPFCGKDLNEGACDCKPETGGPRLEVLRQLIK